MSDALVRNRGQSVEENSELVVVRSGSVGLEFELASEQAGAFLCSAIELGLSEILPLSDCSFAAIVSYE
jgi:hypothetical protein